MIHPSPIQRKSKKSSQSSRKITNKGKEMRKMIDSLLSKGHNSDVEECSDNDSSESGNSR